MVTKASRIPFAHLEFHISRAARDRYQFAETLFKLSGNVIFANFPAARLFAQKMNAHRDLAHHPEQTIRASQINAMGLVDEILHFVVGKYREQRAPKVMEEALAWLDQQVGKERVDAALEWFSREFPPMAVYRGETSEREYLAGESQTLTGIASNRSIVLEEMLMLWLANENPAFCPYQELFEDVRLAQNSAYLEIIDSLHQFFDTQPVFGPDQQNMVDMLRSPAVAVPLSLSGQLEYIRTRWGYLLGDYLLRLLVSLDFIREEEKAIFAGPGPAQVYQFTGLESEVERFSPDRDWMPNLVLIAKNTYVWLDQLSKNYQRPITRLDQIPDEELERLRRWGFTGLWLIGLWERSPASKRIKQMRGNPEAEASAYSLYNYTIAQDLGGEVAYQNLRTRTWQHGIRLASDMVPNHMGIDSPWVIEHPDWFVALDYSPFPSYTFNGQNLSWDSRVGIYLEDHYSSNSDAAVVFKRVDFWTGQEKFIYHGNDGTSMPWNDTAQLNYLMPEVREAVIQTILAVARRFSIIRFDAAMTLTKRHYQRLWFPEPGSGGDIPSRAGNGITKDQFNAAYPVEFWREVVNRVAKEAPDTLLLAEAFWLMEGYFVRSLGMHRVYNSAFMNMLRDEQNQEYRLVIKNTLEFDPEILKRYVNFMNNPDERTAVDQFGKGDKYYGICTLMATLPGLPMFGHGQVEGFTEKYGMEYRRAYWDETPDTELVERHQREVFPLLRKRYLFAGVNNFLLYDFYTPAGHVNEDVFAYSNRTGSERGLVIYHNKFASARGWIRTSAAYQVKTSIGDEHVLVQKSLAEGLELDSARDTFTIFHDQVSGLEYLRPNCELYEQGLYIELEAYKCHVFLDIRQVRDIKGQYAQLTAQLRGKGVPSIEAARRELVLQPIHRAFSNLVNARQLQWLIDHRLKSDDPEEITRLGPILDEVEEKLRLLLAEIKRFTHAPGDEDALAAEIRQDVFNLLKLPELLQQNEDNSKLRACLKTMQKAGASYFKADPIGAADPRFWGIVLVWLLTGKLGKVGLEPNAIEEYAPTSREWLEEWGLDQIVRSAIVSLGTDEEHAWRSVSLIKLLQSHHRWYAGLPRQKTRQAAAQILPKWLSDAEIQQFIGVNQSQERLWFHKESYEEWLYWTLASALIQEVRHPDDYKQLGGCQKIIQTLLKAEASSEFLVEKLITNVNIF